MTDAELEAALLRLRDAQRRTQDGIHELLNILAVWRGEMDLAALAARKVVEGLVRSLDDFYERHPEFRG